MHSSIIHQNREYLNLDVRVLLIGLAEICAYLWDTVNSSIYASIAMYAILLLFIVLNYEALIVKYVFIFYSAITNVIGVWVCETKNIYLQELGFFSSEVGSLPLIVFIHCIFILLLLVYENNDKTEQNIVKDKPFLNGFLLNGSIIIVLLLFTVSVTHPFYGRGQSFDRFAYQSIGFYENLASRMTTWLLYLIPIVVFGIKYNNVYKSLLFLLLYCISSFLTGNKFGTYILLAQILVLGFSYEIAASKKRIKKALLYTVGLFLSLLIIVFIHNRINYGFSLADNATYLTSRLAQQGQLWWRTYSIVNSEGIKPQEISGELASFFNPKADPMSGSYGIYKIMALCVSDTNLFLNKLSRGSRYAFSSQASIYYYFGHLGLIVATIVFSYLYYRVINLLVKALRNENTLTSIVAIKLLMVSNQLFTQSDFNVLFSSETLIFFVVMAFLKLIERRSSVDELARNDNDVLAIMDSSIKGAQ